MPVSLWQFDDDEIARIMLFYLTSCTHIYFCGYLVTKYFEYFIFFSFVTGLYIGTSERLLKLGLLESFKCLNWALGGKKKERKKHTHTICLLFESEDRQKLLKLRRLLFGKSREFTWIRKNEAVINHHLENLQSRNLSFLWNYIYFPFSFF